MELTVIVGALADIHGNLAALEAVMCDMPPVDALICAGDITGYYPHSNQVCALVRELGAAVIRGNHDAYVTRQLAPDPAKVDAYRTEWIRKRLEPDHLKWLASLPVEIRFQWGERQLHVRHASPWDEETYLYPDSPDLSRVQLAACEILLVGHTHHPMIKICGEGLLINPGSVGQPRDWNPMASYVLVNSETAAVTQRRVPYDVARLQGELAAMGWDAKAIEILSRTR